MSQSIYGNHRSSYVIRTPSATRGPQTMTVESRSRDGGTSASNFNVNLSIPIQCEANQAIGYYLKEAHLPLSAWTINKGYDSFQIAFPLSTDSIIYDVHLKHGIYTAAEFAQMVQDALNLVTYNYFTDSYKRHTHNTVGMPSGLDAFLAEELTSFNASLLPKKRTGASATAAAQTGVIVESPVTFSVTYHESRNRFSIERTDSGRLFKSGQFDIAIPHYQIAKAFGCPWNSNFSTDAVEIVGDGEATYYEAVNPKEPSDTWDTRFYIPRSSSNYNGFVFDESGTWYGNSQGKTFRNPHKYYILSSERWSESSIKQQGINVMKPESIGRPLSGLDASNFDYPSIKLPLNTPAHMDDDKVPQTNWYSQTLLMPYTSRIRGDDCFYVRSSLFGGDNIQTNHDGGNSNCLQMVRIDKTLGEVAFWSPHYTPEPHIITRRDIPSIAFQVTDKDHHEVDFNGEEIVLELEFITYDIVSIPLHQPSQEDKYAAPHNFAPDYARRQFPQPIQGGSHLPSGFSNYR